MKNLKTICLMAMASVLMLGSCSKEEGTEPEGPSGNVNAVYLKLAEPEAPVGKAEGSAVADNEPVVLKTGHLFFASNNLVTKYVEIVASNATGDQVTVAELTSGKQIDNVPDNSTQIFLLSNIPAGVTVPTAVSTPVETLKAVQLNASSMGKADGTVDNVALYGYGTIAPNASGDPEDPQEATVTVHAVASRIEIGKITGDDKVDDFSVAGIYINHYYEKVSVDGTTGAGLINNQSDGGKYVNGSAGGYDFANGILHDDFDVSPYSGALAATSLEVKPTGTNVWSYQVLPATTDNEIPHIIIVLEDVVIDGVALSGKQYLTIRGFKNANVELDEIVKGYVYKLADVKFTQDNITDQPEVGDFKVDVTLSLTLWKAVDLTVDWDK